MFQQIEGKRVDGGPEQPLLRAMCIRSRHVKYNGSVRVAWIR